ncbi:ATP/GTP-binding protein [Streptomyces flavofungini]|uniref:ATP/GTP-binding protein n=1 Tax=Streptomyces flavofungini TaxID=68200 RepID=A0ABS0X1E4_9ACTN|nr:ATP/GTP-binding protein [Streptomyces flavofungini]MBJ3806975.1 ATP/GTP-binding protein [Streptomyces flavofungini]
MAWGSGSEGWARAESAVTKTLLLGVFVLGLVAQFVTPVGDALEGKAYLGGAVLSLVGYVLYSEVRGLNVALRPAVRREVAASELRGFFGAALGRAAPRIDAIGFTGETVVNELARSLDGRQGAVRPEVAVRILVPDFTREMAIPGMLDADGKAADDPGFRAELLRQVRGYERDMEVLARRMSHDRRGALAVEFRVLHISPFVKFCLVDREHLFDGIYDEVKEEPSRDLPARQVLDLMGYDSLLTHWHIDAGAAAREKIARRQELFETLWRVARPLTPPAS